MRFKPNIEELKARRDAEGLIRALKDSDWVVRWEAAYALGEIGDERAVEPLIEALKDSDVRERAAEALGKIVDERAVEPLIEALKDSNWSVRLSAAISLGKIGEKVKRECELLIERLKNLNNLGIDTKIEKKKLKDALKELEEGNYSAAIKIKECKEGLKRKINELIERAKELVKEASVPEAEELIEKAESALETCDYENAVKLAKQAEEKALRTLRKVKPEIEVDIPLKEYKLNYWKRTKFILKNKGNAHAKSVEIELSDVVSAELIDKVDLDAGEEKELEVVLKPKEEGEVPLRVKLKYKDLKGREYESERVFLINVSDAERKESEEVRKEPSINIERGIYDPCKGGFLEGEFRRMKEWVNRHDPYAYWLVLSIQNKTGKAIEEWGVELETSSALKFEEARVEGVEYAIKVYESHPEPFRSRYAVGIPKEYGIFIPDGGSHRIYLKMRAEKPKTEYEIRGVFKYAGLKVPVRPKRFKYLCDARTDAEALRVELEKTYTKRDAARLALAFKIIQEMDRMCERRVAKTGEFLEKLSLLKDYTEGLSGKFTKQVEEFARFMKEEQFEYLDEEYKGRVKNLCTRLIDIWISEFLK